MIENIQAFMSTLSLYPFWFRLAFSAWLVLSAVTLSGFFLITPLTTNGAGESSDDFSELDGRIKEKVAEALKVPENLQERYSDVLSNPSSGITKLAGPNLLPDTAIRGGGTYFSFVSRSSEYGFGSDIQLRDMQFHTGFAGANYGHFLRLGSTPLRTVVDTASEAVPSWLPGESAEAWSFFWTYTPPGAMSKIREHQKRARGFTIDGARISESVSVEMGSSYLLRSVMVDDWDVLVAFEVVGILDEGSVVILWRVLKHFDTPIVAVEDAD